MKRQKKKWSAAEISLFAAPLFFIVVFWFLKSNPLPQAWHGASSTAPPATATPVPTPTTPFKVRQDRLIYRVVPSPDGKSLWTLNKLDGKRSIHQFSLSANVWMRAIDNEALIRMDDLKISPDGRTLLYGSSGNQGEYAEIFDPQTAKSRLRLPEGSGTPSVAISPDSRIFALGYDGYFEIRSLKDAHLVHRIHWQSGKKVDFLANACFSRDGNFFAIADSAIGIFSTQTWRPVARYCPPYSELRTFAFAGNNQLVVRCYDRKKVKENTVLWLYNFQSRKARQLRTLDASGGYVLAVSPDEKFVAISDYLSNQTKWLDANTITQGDSLIVEIYDVKQGVKIAASEIPDEQLIPAIAFSADSQTLLLGCENARIRRWPRANWVLKHPNFL